MSGYVSSHNDRRSSPRLYPLSQVDIAIPGTMETSWGSLSNVSRKGVAVHIRQQLRPYTHVTVRFRFLGGGGREVSELLPAKVVWQAGDSVGLEFVAPLTGQETCRPRDARVTRHLTRHAARVGR